MYYFFKIRKKNHLQNQKRKYFKRTNMINSNLISNIAFAIFKEAQVCPGSIDRRDIFIGCRQSNDAYSG